MPTGDRETARLHRDWLQRLSNLTGKSLTKLASEAGLAVSTLTRPVKEGDAGTSTLHARTIDKLSAHTGVAPPALTEAGHAGLGRPMRAFNEDLGRFVPDAENELKEAVAALIAGRSNVEPWQVKTRALELAGYLPDDIVLIDREAPPRLGAIVSARVNIGRGQGAGEAVLRIYERAGAADVLVAASMDPAWRQPIPIDDRVAVTGVVTGMVRPAKH